LQLAEQEADHFSHEYIGTEHILLGLVREGSGVAANVLKNLDIDLRTIRLEVERIVQHGPGGERVVMGPLPRTPRAQTAIACAIDEARDLGHEAVDTEHLLLGLIRELEGVAAQVLLNVGVRLDEARAEVHRERARPAVDPNWLTRNDGAAGAIARTIAREQCWEVMPILADALEEAGCTDAETLAHLRQAGSHGCARRRGCGCWVIDRLLGAEAARLVKGRPPAKRWWQFWR
jgi:ATP-dependent Clp protease ATP-binding subunit ClpA